MSLSDYDIRICRSEDCEDLMEFIDKYWRAGHPLAKSQALLDWQHRSPEGYNFLIARKGEEIHGIIGFIPTGQFDPALGSNDTWLTMWKVREDVSPPSLGLALLQAIRKRFTYASLGIVGSSEIAQAFYTKLGFHIGVMQQHYMVNRKKDTFKLIGNFDGEYSAPCSSTEVSLKPIDGEQLLDFRFTPSVHPHKSPHYYYNRYLCHPSYSYQIFGILRHSQPRGLLVVRKATYLSSNAIRIVDLYGPAEALQGASQALQGLLEDFDAEYLDFNQFGYNNQIFTEAGLLLRLPSSKVIVPNYFEPFEQRNVNIAVAFEGCGNYLIVKGDSDQDRPNMVPVIEHG